MPNWSLAGGANRDFQNALAMGMQMGTMARQAQDRRELKNALVAYDPANPDTLKPVMEANPEIGFRLRQEQQREMARRQEAEQQAMRDRRADIPMLTRLLETATDEQTWQRNRAIAQQYDVDISGAPEQFDQGWRDQQLMTLKAISTPEGQEALSSAGKVAADMGYKPGTPEYNQVVRQVWTESQSKPYVVGGETRLYTPRMGAMGGSDIPKVATPDEAMRLPPGSQFYDPNGVLRVVPPNAGGGGGNVTSGFLNGL